MAIGRTLVKMTERKRDHVTGFMVVVANHRDGGFQGECIAYGSRGQTLGQYLTPAYRKGKNLAAKAKAAADGIRLNLASGYDLNHIPVEVVDFTH